MGRKLSVAKNQKLQTRVKSCSSLFEIWKKANGNFALAEGISKTSKEVTALELELLASMKVTPGSEGVCLCTGSGHRAVSVGWAQLVVSETF